MKKRHTRVFLLTIPYKAAWLGISLGIVASGLLLSITALQGVPIGIAGLTVSMVSLSSLYIQTRMVRKLRHEVKQLRITVMNGTTEDEEFDFTSPVVRLPQQRGTGDSRGSAASGIHQ